MDQRMNKSNTSCKITVNEMISGNMKNYYNKQHPKFGIKNYEVKDNMNLEPYFKIEQILMSKNMKANGVFDQYLKLKS